MYELYRLSSQLSFFCRTNLLASIFSGFSSSSFFLRQANFCLFFGSYIFFGARGGAVVWGTALRAGRSRVRFPMFSFQLPSVFFSVLTLSLAYAVAQLFEALRYEPEGRGFGSRCCYSNYLLSFFGSYIFFDLRGGAVGWGTALRAGRSRLLLSMVSFQFFIDIILPAALWPWDRLSL